MNVPAEAFFYAKLPCTLKFKLPDLVKKVTNQNAYYNPKNRKIGCGHRRLYTYRFDKKNLFNYVLRYIRFVHRVAQAAINCLIFTPDEAVHTRAAKSRWSLCIDHRRMVFNTASLDLVKIQYTNAVFSTS